MAEFKLGRIRFVWKNNWVTSTTYYIDDVILVNGKTYICIKGHTSLSDFNLDLNNSKWQLMSDGQMWRNNWLTTTQYQLNDLVKYGATIYICTQGHMSQALLESDQGKWDIFASGSFEWKTDWAINTVYKVADLVKYGAGLYRCVEGHTSAASLSLGLEDSNSKWDVVSIGFEYKTDWAGSTRYKINDVVKKGGGLWLSLIGHTSDAADFTADSSYWSQFVEGLEFEDSYNVATAYQAGDIVNYGGYQYVAITNHTGTVPTTGSQTDWDLFSTGFSHQGEYNNATAYKVGHVVRVGGFTYVATADTTGNRPPHASWERLNQGQEWQGNWADATLYDLGDIVRHTNSSYVCVSSHTSDQTTLQNRPDQDLDGSEWNQLVGGAETTVLTTEGDIVYYTGSGPSRLPIGSDGQVLKVSGTDLIWDDFGIVNNTFYVAPSGTDSIDYGYTLDKAFKTVRYGLEKIQDGHNSTAAKRLMQRNRAFIQAESVEYVTYNIANPTGIWVGFVNDDIEKCRRDIGQLLDAIIWDLSHGGNERTRLATLTYFLDGALIAAIADENEQLADTVDYMITVVDAVISNLAPAANYQTLNSVATPITQIIDASLIEKTGDQVILNNLGNIISAALIAEVPTNVPVEVKPTSTLFVKTGIFAEVGPMIVPQRTALVGDELRSTKIIPAGVLVAAADVPKSLAAITRLVAVMSDIVTNSAVTISTGNAVTQVTTRPAGSTAAGSAAAALVTDIKEYIDFKINAVGTEPTLAGTNTPNTTTDYTYAVGVIEENRAFLVAEIHAYIAVTYPGYNYNIASCSRDVNSYIDAVLYDLIYTGNYKSLLAATYYVNAVGGSLLQDMFYVRDGSGIRNCTLNGLTGTLGADNAYGTKRPTAGAFVSLDPGYGPADTNVWISSRSPYIQNVSTFGTACIGLKVDGALHAGGNDSIVANDFTQVLTDGIGVWCTNNGRTELVSVFTYYNHIGYLSEAGGKIRAANGNNSYGDYGSVAEGVDANETPISATVNNRAGEAIVSSIVTDGNEILVLEYSNCGQGYDTNATYAITGTGQNAAISASNFRNGGIYQVRLTGLTEYPIGSSYLQVEGNAQDGGTTGGNIMLSGADVNAFVNYDGMRLVIISGAGAGQYGYITAYNNDATKLCVVAKESDNAAGWEHFTGATIVAPDATSRYRIEPRVTISAPASGTQPIIRAFISGGGFSEFRIIEPGSGYTVGGTAPTITITDPNNTQDAAWEVRVGNGVLAQPTWSNRGTSYLTAFVATITGVGYADQYALGSDLSISGLTQIPGPGANLEFTGDSTFYSVTEVKNLAGAAGSQTATLSITPYLKANTSPTHTTGITIRENFSQVRLTGHDFLDVGTGGFATTQYPARYVDGYSSDNNPSQEKEAAASGGGRVFYTSTDQDGNFRVGELFKVEQASGVITLNADDFQLTGLTELRLGGVSLGGTSAVVREFSTDRTFAANADTIVPTQKAINLYIEDQIGGGGADVVVSGLVAGQTNIINGNEISSATTVVNFPNQMNFEGGVDGDMLRAVLFIQGNA